MLAQKESEKSENFHPIKMTVERRGAIRQAIRAGPSIQGIYTKDEPQKDA
jgi:hypothetical protein